MGFGVGRCLGGALGGEQQANVKLRGGQTEQRTFSSVCNVDRMNNDGSGPTTADSLRCFPLSEPRSTRLISGDRATQCNGPGREDAGLQLSHTQQRGLSALSAWSKALKIHARLITLMDSAECPPLIGQKEL